MKTILLVISLAALTACSHDNETDNKDLLMHTDFDSLVGWVPEAPSLSKGQAHSGHYSLKVDKGLEFSLGYSAVLGQMSSTRLRGVHMEAWAFLPTKDSKARLGFIVKDAVGGKDLLGDGLDLQDQVKDPGKWTKISKDFTFPATASYTSQLLMFMWGPGANGPIYLDDLQLTALR
jgi:hypothetical protein